MSGFWGVDILKDVLQDHGFSAFLVVLTIGVVIWFTVYVNKRMEKLHDAEVKRLVDERDWLLEKLIGERRSSSEMKKLMEEDAGKRKNANSQAGGGHDEQS